ncbi:MAG: MtaA/CmuA family methyltransferase [Desulfobacterales bacterium]|jgi:[methyl-Co(III) methanol-specific corrinoid protein]:coenzyme M methyltransferase
MKSSSYNLVMSALFNGRKGDRPPVGNPTSVVCHGLMEEAGVSFPDAHIDANAMADLALAGHEILGFDTVMPEYSVQQEAAALGCTMDWGDRDRMPDNKDFPNADFSDVQVPENILEKPSMKVVLDALSILRKHVGGKVAIIGKVMGPWTLSYHMAGTQNFLLQIGMGETESVKKMLRQLMPVTVAFARAQFEAGADIVVLADHATGNLVGPYHYEELLLPIHQEITNQIEGPLILHVCGDCSDRLELFAASGVDAYHFEWQVDAKTAVDKVGHLISLVGNINNPKTLYQGTPDDVYQQVRYSIAAGVNIIGPECAIPLATPIENLKAIVEAAREGY